MKIKNLILVSIIAAISAADLLFAQAACATADPTVVNQTFAGTYRAPVKTSIAKPPAVLKECPDLSSLLQSLPKDSAMRSKYSALRKGVRNWPKQREPEELVNAKIDSCWICAVKYEHGAKADNDFHLVLSNSPKPPFTTVMNMEVAGLPKTGPDVSRLKSLRATFLSFFKTTPPSGSFTRVSPPIHVQVEGSLYFDGDHNAGGKSDPGPSWAKPKTVWEVHPIYKLTRLN
jgi:hypothetical protein